MTYIPIPQNEKGNVKRALTSDERVIELLGKILIELKKIEYHLMLATDTDLKDI